MDSHWEPTSRPWWETSVTNCSLCGQMIPGDAWVAEHHRARQVFCSPDCERLWHDYWVPRYGRAEPPVS